MNTSCNVMYKNQYAGYIYNTKSKYKSYGVLFEINKQRQVKGFKTLEEAEQYRIETSNTLGLTIKIGISYAERGLEIPLTAKVFCVWFCEVDITYLRINFDVSGGWLH